MVGELFELLGREVEETVPLEEGIDAGGVDTREGLSLALQPLDQDPCRRLRLEAAGRIDHDQRHLRQQRKLAIELVL